MKIAYLSLDTDSEIKEGPQFLRGFFGNKFKELPLFHHHLDDAGYVYLYPRIQYKIISGKPLIMGLSEGASAIKEVSDKIDELILNGSRYKVRSANLTMTDFNPRPSRDMIEYRFATPWIGLNQKNYVSYNKITDQKERKEFLNNIIVGNILSFSKGFGIVCEKRMQAHSRLDPAEITFKGVNMKVFTGNIRVNYEFPELAGMGKAVSFGFGSVMRVGNGDINK